QSSRLRAPRSIPHPPARDSLLLDPGPLLLVLRGVLLRARLLSRRRLLRRRFLVLVRVVLLGLWRRLVGLVLLVVLRDRRHRRSLLLGHGRPALVRIRELDLPLLLLRRQDLRGPTRQSLIHDCHLVVIDLRDLVAPAERGVLLPPFLVLLALG